MTNEKDSLKHRISEGGLNFRKSKPSKLKNNFEFDENKQISLKTLEEYFGNAIISYIDNSIIKIISVKYIDTKFKKSKNNVLEKIIKQYHMNITFDKNNNFLYEKKITFNEKENNSIGIIRLNKIENTVNNEMYNILSLTLTIPKNYEINEKMDKIICMVKTYYNKSELISKFRY